MLRYSHPARKGNFATNWTYWLAAIISLAPVKFKYSFPWLTVIS